jgi:transcription initiation factor TFIIB
MDFPSVERCPECGSTSFLCDSYAGEVVCSNCGLVVETLMDYGPERHTLKQDSIRVGMPVTYSIHDKGLSTVISEIDRDALGKRVTLATYAQMARLRRAQRISCRGRSLREALGELKRILDRLSAPKWVREQSAAVYREALRKNVIRGRTITGMAAASIYTVYRNNKIPVTLEEVAEASSTTAQDVGRCYRHLVRMLDLKVPATSTTAFIFKIGRKAGVSQKAQNAAVEILERMREKGITAGKNPHALAAAALYVACIENGEDVRQYRLASAASITDVTLRNRLSDMRRKLGLKLDGRRKWRRGFN